MTTLRFGAAVDAAASLFAAQGMNEQRARISAQAIVASDVWGIGSHGLMRLSFYLERMAAGGINAKADLTSTVDLPSMVMFDGDNGLGHWQVRAAADTATERARSQGIAAVGVARSNHCGALGLYVWPMISEGMIGIAFSNGPAVMPPWGGSAPVLSTSPIAAGLPTSPSTVIDLATSAVARGKIAARAQAGQPLEDGWAFDAAGAPTTDAKAALAGMLAPLGGVKGYAIALLVESLTGGLVGPSLSTSVPDMFDSAVAEQSQQISHLVLAINVAALGNDAESRLALMAAEVERTGGRLPGSRRPDPESISDDTEFTIADNVHEQLRSWGERHAITW
jgi:(2R)-3-sulfolactate dehydrogenase (NADP+)